MQPGRKNIAEYPENCVRTVEVRFSCSIAKHKSIPELSKGLDLVRTSASVLQFLSTHDKLIQNRLLLVAREIADAVPGSPVPLK